MHYAIFFFTCPTEFNYTLKWVDDGNYGSKDKKTGKWNGVIKELIAEVLL